ncbi:tetratricopeptide repeat protein [Rhodopirellula sp. MGV]|uniref:tetratricopeptide repeat protein n=1 Tax=Rhodopirellula sp. MGV TaxID=2023130 RepID=UPI000B969324|nr:tetratricopeptide repeat protein [Rhodopirellula sp. MGV]OYP32334.1 hypothetical protein CGZ80_19910 [Rhodopirellula sp. MGV]PNY35883.1 tetratricopeptide repeat protein [Rhodopirellula baltica]
MGKSHSKPKRSRGRRQSTRATDGASLAELIATALELQNQGKLAEAKQLYCQVLAQDPTNADAWHLLGMTLYSGAAYAEALECIQKARQFGEDRADLIGHLALIRHAMGQSDQAIEIMRAVIDAEPANPEHYNNLGVMQLESGKVVDAQVAFEQSLQLAPGDAQAAMNLGNCLMRQNRLIDAESMFRTLLADNPANCNLITNLGECLRRQTRFEEALEVLEQAIVQNPHDQVMRVTHARVLEKLDRLEEAKKSLVSVVNDFPSSAKAYHYLGHTLMRLGEVEAAEENLRHALQLSPDNPHALCSLGFTQIAADRRQDALETMKEAVRIDPSHSEANGCVLYLMTGDPSFSPEEVFQEHLRWGERHGSPNPIDNHQNDRDPNRRLRIGYASADFRKHAVSVFFEPLLRLADSSQFETFCYYEYGVSDEVTRQLKSYSDHWRTTVGYSDEQVVRQVIEDKIDILVDLSGHTSGNRLTAWSNKPAPVQISWLGYPNTTGLKAMDYTLTCEVQNPLDEPSYHSEELLRIPGGSFSFQPPGDAPELTPLPALRNGYVTFGSLHRPFKISETTQDMWAAAMHACPNSKLLATNTWFNERSKQEIRDGLVARGIDRERIEIRDTFESGNYLTAYSEIDIGLDATPWAGGTTTMGALWMGVPVVAIYGKNRPSRGTAGIVHHLGHPEWIARSQSEYAEKLRALSSDVDALAALRQTLRQQTSDTIANEQRFVTEVEKAYRSIWKRWCESKTTSVPLAVTSTVAANVTANSASTTN